MTGFLEDWTAYYKDECDRESMDFADCFNYIEVKNAANCTAFTARSQCSPPDPRNFEGRRNAAQIFYGAFNIWNIQNWFYTYYTALTTANSLSSEQISTIARTMNVPIPKGFPLEDFLASLAFALGLLSPSGYGAVIPHLGTKVGAFATQCPGEYLLRGVQGSPTLSRVLLNSGDLSQTDIQIAQLGTELASITAQLENNVQNAVVSILSNYTLFMDFVGSGYFSTQIQDLNTLAQNITLSLNTYMTSQALQDDKVIITRALNTDIDQLQKNGSAIGYDTGCGHGYNEWGMCGQWWFDKVSNTSYGLHSMKDMLLNYTEPLLSLFNQGITTPELLFINSQICADAAGSNQGSAPGANLTTQGGIWNTQCVSNMKICTWNTEDLSVFKEWTDCDREPSFATEGCGQGTDINQALVPATYIGQWLTGGQFQGIVCNKLSKGSQNPG